MKRNFNLFLMSLLVFGLMAACDKPEPDNGKDDDDKTEQPNPDDGKEDGKEDGKDDGNDDGDGNQTGDLFNKEFPFMAAFPLEPGNLIAEGSDVGVTIEVTRVEEQNFVFELRPGAMVQSFKFDVYPLAQLYNNLLNDRNAGVLTGTDAIDMAEHIRTYIFNTSGSGGYEISVNDFDNPEDFLQIEFDWMSTAYAGASAIAVPDCGYVIAVVAGTEPSVNTSNQEQITLCYVHTPSQPLIGDPQVEIEVTVGYHAFGVQHYPNSDAAGVYFFGGLTNEIDEYIDIFGDTMFRDFMRTRVTGPSVYDPDVEGSCYYSFDYGQGADHNILSTTCAVAVDANLTPQEGYSRSDFHLLEIPEDAPIAEPNVALIPERIAAAYFEFYAEMPKDCQTIFYRIYSPEQKEALENASSLEQKLEAISLVNEGYGCHNPNFAWDKNADEPAVGAQGKVKLDYYAGLQPGATYYVGYTGRNGYGQPGPLKFSDPVTLDKRNLTSPDECKVKDLKLWLSSPGRTKFTQNITYDPQTVSMVYVQYMTEKYNPGLTPESSWSEWMNYIFSPSQTGTGSIEYSNADVNAWPTLPSGRDPFTWTGMEPNTKYTVFLCAEDFDGNVSPMLFDSIVTAEVQVGPDPTMNLSLEPYSRGDSYDWTVKYEIDHDVEYFLYCYTQGTSELAAFIPGLNQGHLNNIAGSGIDYETWWNGIYLWVAGGFENNGGGMRANSDTSQDWSGDQVTIAACIAVGQDADGEPVYKMYHLICKGGKAQTLEEIFGITE